MLQLGHEAISYHNPIPVHDYGDKYLVQQLSAQIYEDDVPKELFARLQKEPHAYITSAIGADKLDKDKIIRTGRCGRPRNAKADEGQRLDCFITCAAGTYAEVLRRAGTNKVFIQTVGGKDENTRIVNLPLDYSLDKALLTGRTLGLQSLGVVKTERGLAIRCLPEDRETVERHINPQQAVALGDLFTLTKENATQYLVKGFSDAIDKEGVRFMLQETAGLRCRPVKPTRKPRGRQDWLVYAPVTCIPFNLNPTVTIQHLCFHLAITKMDEKPAKSIYTNLIALLTPGVDQDDFPQLQTQQQANYHPHQQQQPPHVFPVQQQQQQPQQHRQQSGPCFTEMRTFSADGFRTDYKNNYPNYTAEEDSTWFHESDTQSEADRETEREARRGAKATPHFQLGDPAQGEPEDMDGGWCDDFSHLGCRVITT